MTENGQDWKGTEQDPSLPTHGLPAHNCSRKPLAPAGRGASKPRKADTAKDANVSAYGTAAPITSGVSASVISCIPGPTAFRIWALILQTLISAQIGGPWSGPDPLHYPKQSSTWSPHLPKASFPSPVMASPSGTASPLLMTVPNPTILWSSAGRQLPPPQSGF